MERTTDFHHEIADALLPQADPVFDDATAFDTTVDMLNAQSAIVQGLVGQLLFQGEFLAAWLLRRHQDRHLREREGQEAQILQQPTPGRERVGDGLRDTQIMDTAAVRVAQKEDDEHGIDEQDIFDGVISFLPAITLLLFNRVLGADDPPFCPVRGKRGEVASAAGSAPPCAGSSSSGVTTVAASASETPSRWARAMRERAGASPRVRSAASSAGKRTWIH